MVLNFICVKIYRRFFLGARQTMARKNVYNDKKQEAFADSFITKIRDLLNEKNLSVNRLADLTTLDQSGFNKKLNKELKIQLNDVLICADFFKVSVDWLLGRTDIKEIGNSTTTPIPINQCESIGEPLVSKESGKLYSEDDIKELVVYLLKKNIAKSVPIIIKEKVVYHKVKGADENFGEVWIPRNNQDVTYRALYFPKYWDPSGYKSEYLRMAEMCATDNGNILPDMEEVNNLIETVDHFLPDYRKGRIPDKVFDQLVLQTEEE